MKIRHRPAKDMDELDKLDTIGPHELLAGDFHKTIDPVIAAMMAKKVNEQ